MLLEVRAAFLHLDQHDRLPHEICEGGAAGVVLAHAHLEGGAGGLETARPAEGDEEVVQKNLGLAFFIAGQVLAAPGDELRKFLRARHGGVVAEGRPFVSNDAANHPSPIQRTPHSNPRLPLGVRPALFLGLRARSRGQFCTFLGVVGAKK